MGAERPGSRLGALAGLLPEALLLVTREGVVTDANPAVAGVFAKPLAALVGRRLHEFVSDRCRESLGRYLGECARSGSLLPGSLELLATGERYRCEGARMGGADAPIVLRLRARASASNRFRLLNEKIAELAAHVAERHRAETLLESQLGVLELIGRSAPMDDVLEALVRLAERHGSEGLLASVLLLDEDGRRLRHGAAPSLPATYNEVVDGLEIGPAVGSCGTAAYTREPVVAHDIAGDPRWRDFRELALSHDLRSCWSTPILASDGSVLGTFALYYREPRDPPSTDRRVVAIATRLACIAIERKNEEGQVARLLASERAARTEAEAANRAKDEFLALVSHELRNPLNAMLGWTKLLRMPELDDKTRDQGVETIERNAELQAQLIEDMLDFARVSSGQLKLDLQPTRIEEIVEEAVDSALPDAENAGVRIDLETGRIAPTRAAPARLHQVITNLLGNAIKFTPPGGRVTVVVAEHEGCVRIVVTDTGQGIERDYLPVIFEPFRQADGSLARSHSGLGLGLAVVRHIVELHGGCVGAHSDGPGKGATFTIEIPLRPVDLPAESEQPRQASDVAGLRVLLVDDEADARDLLATALRHHGAEPTVAGSTVEATAALDGARDRGERLDVLVSDIAMPGADGYALMRLVRAREDDFAAIPAAALSAHARDADRAQAHAAGYDRHLAKPVDIERLLAVVADLAQGVVGPREA